MLISHHPETFVSAKCAAPLRARHPAMRAALVRESLDPTTRRLSYLAEAAAVAAASVEPDAVVVERGGTLHYLDVVTALACNDLLELDLESGPLGPSTMVRTRG
jgi:hypothetical protein